MNRWCLTSEPLEFGGATKVSPGGFIMHNKVLGIITIKTTNINSSKLL